MRFTYPAAIVILTLIANTAVAADSTTAEFVGQAEAKLLNTQSGPSASAARTVEECWKGWLNDNKLVEGTNRRPDGTILYIASSSFPVRTAPGSQAWAIARSAAFTQAELAARANLAEYIGVDLRSSRQVSFSQNGGDEAPPSSAQPKPPSNIERLNTLTGLALDNAIRQYDPNWNGGGLTDDEKRKRAIVEINRVNEEDLAQSRLYAAGAFTVAQCEGPSSATEGGQYSVLAGLIQSTNLVHVAAAMADPRLPMPRLPPKQPVLEQFEQRSRETPDWMAFTEGARVWADENGSPVVVGFGVAAATSFAPMDKIQAHLRALAAIQRFVGEEIVAHSSGSSAFAETTTAKQSTRSFDTSVFESLVVARAKELHLSGVRTLGEWRGKHPYGNVGLQVEALAWSPVYSADSHQVGATMQSQGPTPSSTGGRRAASSGGPVAAPVRQGASSDTSGF